MDVYLFLSSFIHFYCIVGIIGLTFTNNDQSQQTNHSHPQPQKMP